MAVTINGSTGISTPGMSSTGDVTLAGSGVDVLNNSGNKVLGQTGSIIQVVNTTYTTTFSQSVPARTKLNNVQATITPTSTTSKILVMYNVFFEPATADHNISWFLFRDSTDIAAPTAGTRTSTMSATCLGYDQNDLESTASMGYVQYFDTPATTSAVTYAPGVVCTGTTTTIYVNRTLLDADGPGFERGISSITLMEIAA